MAHDPRPVVREAGDGATIEALRCDRCATVRIAVAPRCPSCGASAATAVAAGPAGIVWSSTTVRIAVGERHPPYSIAYVDFEPGLRVLCHVDFHGSSLPDCGSRVELLGTTPFGDVRVGVE